MKLFLDDIRPCPEGFMLFRPNDIPMFFHFARHCKDGDILSLDHDLGFNDNGVEYMNGYQVLCELEKQVREQCIWQTRGMPTIVIHSSNPVGKERMNQVIESIKSYLKTKIVD